MKRFFSTILAVLMLASALVGCGDDKKPTQNNDGFLTVYFFDVGQADSSLLLFPDDTVMLIDAGNKADGEEIADFIDDLNIDVIDYFVCTHPHEDHIGGALDIFDEFKVLNVCVPNIEEDFLPDTLIYKDLVTAIEKEGSRESKLSGGTAVIEKEHYNVTALSPSKSSVFSDMNDYSLTLLVNCFTNTILFTGDAEAPAELDMLASGINLDADILKVGHHGSGNSSTEDFLKAVTPQVSVISCGEGNTYGHPHDDAVKRLGKIGSKVFRTDTVGTVIAKCYNGGFNIETDSSVELDGNR